MPTNDMHAAKTSNVIFLVLLWLIKDRWQWWEGQVVGRRCKCLTICCGGCSFSPSSAEDAPLLFRAPPVQQTRGRAHSVNSWRAEDQHRDFFRVCVRPPCVQGSLWPGRWSSGGEGRAWERAERVMARQRGCWHYVSHAAWEWGLLADGSWARLTWRRPPPEQTAGDPAWWACLLKMRQVLPHLPICGRRTYKWNFGHIT